MPINSYEKRRLQRRDARILDILETNTIPATAKRFRLTPERVRQIKQATVGISAKRLNVGKSYTKKGLK